MRLPPVLLLDLDDTIVSFSATPRDFWREAYRIEQLRFGGISEQRFIDAVQVVRTISDLIEADVKSLISTF